VSLDVIERLADAFAELRLLVEQGVLAYPYSTRELVNITRHLQVPNPHGNRTAAACALGLGLGLAWLGRHAGRLGRSSALCYG
jgi:hypothetical protein